MEEKPFLHLSVDLPPPPLFRDELKESIIPQVPILQILNKFDGVTEQEIKTYKENFIKRYEIVKLPKYLILCFRVSFLLLLSDLKNLNSDQSAKFKRNS
jgi:U4/U6.U5 tri-snRNP-associated protein 2